MSFMVAQLNLFAELCRDRNYFTIAFIRRCFTLSSALGVVNNELIHPKIRAAFLNVILRAWVDTTPLTAVNLPLFSRMIHGESTFNVASAPAVEQARHKELGPLRHVVLNHFSKLQDGQTDEKNFS